MTKKSLLLVAVLMLAAATPVFAQSGCVDSPENPTAILALAGSAGAFAVGLRGRFRRK